MAYQMTSSKDSKDNQEEIERRHIIALHRLASRELHKLTEASN
jgi:hypothetical protein